MKRKGAIERKSVVILKTKGFKTVHRLVNGFFVGSLLFFLLLLLLSFNSSTLSGDSSTMSFTGQHQSVGIVLWFTKCRRNENASLTCQYSHINSNELPLRSVSSFPFRLIKYDINAHELIETLNVRI